MSEHDDTSQLQPRQPDQAAQKIASVPFPHLLYRFVLTYSNVEAIHLCFSESFEALAEGFESCLWQVEGAAATSY